MNDKIIESFRIRLIELDDCNTHMNNIHEPIKGDIYFDGVEMEAFLLSALSEARQSALEECKGVVEGKMDTLLAQAEGPMDDETYALKIRAICRNQALSDTLKAIRALMTH